MLNHRTESKSFLSPVGPTPAQDAPAPSGLRLGMHCSMIIAASRREQSLALNGEKHALKGAVCRVSRDGLELPERPASNNQRIIWS